MTAVVAHDLHPYEPLNAARPLKLISVRPFVEEYSTLPPGESSSAMSGSSLVRCGRSSSVMEKRKPGRTPL